MKSDAVKDLVVLLFSSDWFLATAKHTDLLSDAPQSDLETISSGAKSIVRELMRASPTSYWGCLFSSNRRQETFRKFLDVAVSANSEAGKRIDALASFSEEELDTIWAFVSVLPQFLRSDSGWIDGGRRVHLQNFLLRRNSLPPKSEWDREVEQWIGDPPTLVEDFYFVQFCGIDMARSFHAHVQDMDEPSRRESWDLLAAWVEGAGFRNADTKKLQLVCAKAAL